MKYKTSASLESYKRNNFKNTDLCEFKDNGRISATNTKDWA